MNSITKVSILSIFLFLSCKKDKLTEKDPLDYTKKINGSFYFSGLSINEATSPFEIKEYLKYIYINYINNKTLVLPVLRLSFPDTFYYAYTDKNEKKIVYTYFFDDHDFLVKDTIIYYYDQNIIHYNGYLENYYGIVGRHKLKANM